MPLGAIGAASHALYSVLSPRVQASPIQTRATRSLCIHPQYFTHLSEAEPTVLYTIALILVILWLLGLVSAYTIGGFIHVLLVVAIVLVLVRVIQGRSPTT